jgi:acetamidase/formamidase
VATYTLESVRATLHGTYSRDYAPVLTVDSGDTVSYRLLDSGWNLEPWQEPRPGTARKVEPREREKDWGHCLCGPIAIRGAKPKMTLAIRLDRIQIGSWGWSSGGGGPWGANTWAGTTEPPEVNLRWDLDPENLIGRSHLGHTVRLRPFLGNVGMPPAEPGFHSTYPPRFCGGNIDCKELVAGSTLYLPIPVVGGLLSLGDGHGLQGDGEVSGPALECPMERVDATFTLHEEMRLSLPRANTPAGWIAFGFHEDLNEATKQALSGILDIMTELYGCARNEAVNLASLVVDLRITQLVNGVRGVHAVLPHGAVGGWEPRV